MKPPFITRLSLTNYKSIGRCDLTLPPLGFLVGPNGSGKSNLLDALAFISEALNTSLEHAIRDRGGFREVCRRTTSHINPAVSSIEMHVDFNLPEIAQHGYYKFSVAGGLKWSVMKEECEIYDQTTKSPHYFSIKEGRPVESSVAVLPAAMSDRLFLVAASGLPEFRPVFDAFSSIRVHQLNPAVIGEMQKPDAGAFLSYDGHNLASILRRFSPPERQHVINYLSKIVPEIIDVQPSEQGGMESLDFLQNHDPHVFGKSHVFPASSMSDGTLRALATLVAVFQKREVSSLVGIEEPEIALHPAASSVLLAALREASQNVQILVSSHSPDLLDNPDIDPSSIFAVEKQEGVTRIAGVDDASMKTLKDKLFTPGELLRLNQLAPAPEVRDSEELLEVREE